MNPMNNHKERKDHKENGGDYPLCSLRSLWLNSFSALSRPRDSLFEQAPLTPPPQQ